MSLCEPFEAGIAFSDDDQTLDVYAIEASDITNLTRIAWGLRNGSFVEDECVHHWRTRRVWIVTETRLPVNLDGELVSRTPRHSSVVPDAMNVLAPRTSAGPRVARNDRWPRWPLEQACQRSRGRERIFSPTSVFFLPVATLHLQGNLEKLPRPPG